MQHLFNRVAHSPRWSWMILAAAASSAIIAGSFAWAQSQSASGGEPPSIIQRPEDAPTPRIPNRFVNWEGKFYVLPWDDREIRDEAKRDDPVYNPAWVPLSECLAGRGLEVRANPAAKFSQDDLDRLLERVNRENPDPAANLTIPAKASGHLAGAAGAFIDCAEQWLTKSPEEIAKLTGAPWPPPPSAKP